MTDHYRDLREADEDSRKAAQFVRRGTIEDALEETYPWLKRAKEHSTTIIQTLYEKEKAYGGSWQRRGGVGAFMMAARKWDRIENIVGDKHKYDVFLALQENTGDVADDIDDLIAYLLLIRGNCLEV